ncbi:DUF1835 domain-containing protein [Ureibacillus sp. FSL K6-0165]|uniref:DUF1835 domain-containing protein n=1 Tax=Ureibacillus sp. FSL K6-0165 TaxID=2954606 RepID=UPI0030FA4B59
MDINQLKKAISNLSEQEVKSLLHLIMIRSEHIDEDFPEFMQSLKNALIKREKTPNMKNPETIHIVFGASAAGGLKHAFKDQQTEEIIELPDYFAEGPLKHYHTPEGFEQRYQWFKENYQWDSEHAEWYKFKMKEAFEKIQSINPEQRVVIWTSSNASEQTGLRLVLYLLKEKTNAVCKINTYEAYHKLYKGKEEDFPRHTGELNIEQLRACYELVEMKELTVEMRHSLAKEGEQLFTSESILRTYKNGQILSAESNRDDDFIIEKLKEIHETQGKKDFLKAARLIGEVLGHMQQHTSYEWLEYRLRQLIAEGKVEYQGELRGMRYYEVKLKEALAG